MKGRWHHAKLKKHVISENHCQSMSWSRVSLPARLHYNQYNTYANVWHQISPRPRRHLIAFTQRVRKGAWGIWALGRSSSHREPEVGSGHGWSWGRWSWALLRRLCWTSKHQTARRFTKSLLAFLVLGGGENKQKKRHFSTRDCIPPWRF